MKGKRVEITAQIEEWITAAVEEIDTSKIAVYESVSASTRPINQKGSFYDKAVMAQSMIDEMIDHVNGGKPVTLQVMHNDYQLPEGRVFRASKEAAPDGFSTNLVTLFYIPLSSEKLVNDIDLGVINEVSVGTKPKKALCSECGYDYFDFSQKDAQWAIWERTCANDHVLGVDGVHLNLVGLDSWPELSLVNRGASDKAKIRGSASQTLSKENRERLAACGINPDHLFLHCSATEGDSNVDPSKLISELTDLKAAATTHGAELKAKDVELKAAQDANTALTSEIEGLKAELAQAKENDAAKELETTKAALSAITEERDTAVNFLKEQAKLAHAASDNELKDFETLEDATKAIADAQVKLHQLVPAGGAAAGSEDAPKVPARFSSNAYSVRK